jgi:hypothetical protein
MPIDPYNPQGRVRDRGPAKEDRHDAGAAMDVGDES